MRKRKPTRAFTLIERLLVIATIALLASLLLPSVSGVKSRIRNVSCLNNLKQWGIATALYAAENSDALPPEGVPNPSESPRIQQFPSKCSITIWSSAW